MSAPTPNEIVIAIDHECIVPGQQQVVDPLDPNNLIDSEPTRCGNNAYYFFPVEKPLRSTWSAMRCGPNIPHQLTPLINRPIPGQRVHLDMEARVGRITDALGDESNAEFLKTIRRVALQFDQPVKLGHPLKDEVIDLKDDGTYWTWVMWMRRCLDGVPPNERFAVPVQNCDKLPSLEEIIRTRQARLPIYDGAVAYAMKGRKHYTPELMGMEDAAFQESEFQQA